MQHKKALHYFEIALHIYMYLFWRIRANHAKPAYPY